MGVVIVVLAVVCAVAVTLVVVERRDLGRERARLVVLRKHAEAEATKWRLDAAVARRHRRRVETAHRRRAEAVRAGTPAAAWLTAVERRRMVVHCKDDRSIEGTVSSAGDDGVVLVAAKLIGPRLVDLAGEIWIPRDQVVFVQTVSAP